MDVNSVAFKNKCSFLVSPRYELFLSLASAASEQSNTVQALKPWQTEVDGFLRGLESEVRTGLRFSAVIASFYPSLEADLSTKELISYIEDISPEKFTYLFLDGLLHDKEICQSISKQEVTLKTGINRIAQKKREWLSYIEIYPYDPQSKVVRFLEFLIEDQLEAKTQMIEAYKVWAKGVFSKFWQEQKSNLKESIRNHREQFQNLDFEEFSNQSLLKIRLSPKGDAIEAMRGGYKIDCADIERVFFVPSVFNTDRLWSSIERSGEANVVYFPYLDINILQKLGSPRPVQEIDPLLVCKAIGDPTRFALVKMLSKDPQPAVSLAEKLGLTRATISHHISILKESGILEDDGKGRQLRIQWSNLAGLSESLAKSLRKTRK